MGSVKCSEKGCRNKVSGKYRICPKCQSRKWREKHPVEAAYITLKANAKRRGKPCTITLEDFKAFCYETDYIAGKGRSLNSLTIDCKINELGYVPGNIRPLPLIDNARKGKKVLEYDWQTGYATVNSLGQNNFINNDNIF